MQVKQLEDHLKILKKKKAIMSKQNKQTKKTTTLCLQGGEMLGFKVRCEERQEEQSGGYNSGRDSPGWNYDRVRR